MGRDPNFVFNGNFIAGNFTGWSGTATTNPTTIYVHATNKNAVFKLDQIAYLSQTITGLNPFKEYELSYLLVGFYLNLNLSFNVSIDGGNTYISELNGELNGSLSNAKYHFKNKTQISLTFAVKANQGNPLYLDDIKLLAIASHSPPPFSTTQSPFNLVLNGNFDTGNIYPWNWSGSGASIYMMQNTDFTYSLGFKSIPANTFKLTQTINLIKFLDYNLSFYIRTYTELEPTTVNFGVSIDGGDTYINFLGYNSSQPLSWTRCSYFMTGKPQIQLCFAAADFESSYFVIDKIELVPTNIPDPPDEFTKNPLNLVLNGYFETGIESWIWTGQLGYIGAIQKTDMSYSLGLKSVDTIAHLKQDINLNAIIKYELSFWIKTFGMGSAFFNNSFNVSIDGGSTYIDELFDNGDESFSTWTRFSYLITGKTQIQLCFSVQSDASSTSYFVLDNVELVPILEDDDVLLPQGDENLVLNGYFETGKEQWDWTGPTNCIYVFQNTGRLGFKSVGSIAHLTQTINLNAFVEYELSYWIKTYSEEVGEPITIIFDGIVTTPKSFNVSIDGGITYIEQLSYYSELPPQSSVWTKYTYTFTSQSQIQLRFSVRHDFSYFLIDNIELHSLTTTTHSPPPFIIQNPLNLVLNGYFETGIESWIWTGQLGFNRVIQTTDMSYSLGLKSVGTIAHLKQIINLNEFLEYELSFFLEYAYLDDDNTFRVSIDGGSTYIIELAQSFSTWTRFNHFITRKTQIELCFSVQSDSSYFVIDNIELVPTIASSSPSNIQNPFNLVLNGYFETGIEQWNWYGLPQNIYNIQHSDSTYSLELKSVGNIARLTQTINLSEFLEYELSYWLKIPDEGYTNKIFTASIDGGITDFIEFNAFGPSLPWTQFSSTFSKKTEIQLCFNVRNDSSFFVIDNIELLHVKPNPPPYITNQNPFNLVLNGYFETGIEQWNWSGQPEYIKAIQHSDSTYSLGLKSAGNIAHLTQIINLNAIVEYKLSYLISSINGEIPHQKSVNVSIDGGKTYISDLTYDLDKYLDWTPFSYLITGKTQIQLCFSVRNDSSFFAIYNVELVPDFAPQLPPPTIVQNPFKLILNGDFETGNINPWKWSGRSDLIYVIQNTDATYSLALKSVAITSSLFSKIINVDPSIEYELSYWLRTRDAVLYSPTDNVSFNVSFNGGISYISELAYDRTKLLPWTRFTFRVHGKTKIKLCFRVQNDSSYFVIDNIELISGSPPPECRIDGCPNRAFCPTGVLAPNGSNSSTAMQRAQRIKSSQGTIILSTNAIVTVEPPSILARLPGGIFG